MPESSEKETGYLDRLRRWFGNHIYTEAPESLEVCEFECRKFQCSMGDWEKCERRLGSRLRDQARS